MQKERGFAFGIATSFPIERVAVAGFQSTDGIGVNRWIETGAHIF
jgi:hypothetical protein